MTVPVMSSPARRRRVSRDQALDQAVAPTMALAFAPVHKRAFGTALGLAAGLLVATVTVVTLLRAPSARAGVELLGNFFYGYTVSPAGILVGFAWGFFVGYVVGWFTAFCRNLAIALTLFAARTRADLSATRDFLDHV